MQLTKSNMKRSAEIQKFVANEHNFIWEVLDRVLTSRKPDAQKEYSPANKEQPPAKKLKTGNAKRAGTVAELITNVKKSEVPTKKQSYKERLEKKSLQKRVKRKELRQRKQIQTKPIPPNDGNNVLLSSLKNEQKHIKDESKNKVVFSNVTLKTSQPLKSIVKSAKEKKALKAKKPQAILKKLQAKKEKFNRLEQEGKVTEVVHAKEKEHWNSALARAAGIKVKDDLNLVKKTVKKMEQKKRVSKKKWEERTDRVLQDQQKRQAKRQENIEKRKKDKKMHKQKRAVKRGKVIPGF